MTPLSMQWRGAGGEVLAVAPKAGCTPELKPHAQARFAYASLRLTARACWLGRAVGAPLEKWLQESGRAAQRPAVQQTYHR